MGVGRVELGLVGIGDLVSRGRIALLLPVDAALNLFGIVFQRVVRCQVELILAVDAFDGHAVGRYGVEVRIDDGIHGQIEGQLAVRAAKVTGTQEMAEHDVQDFVTDRTEHLLRRLLQKQRAEKKGYISCRGMLLP